MTMDVASRSQLPAVLVGLLRGVVYREQSAGRWRDLLGLQAAARDYVRVLGLELIIDEAEGFAFLRQFEADNIDERSHSESVDTANAGETTASDAAGQPLPRLIARRQLSYQVSVLLVQLRKRLAQHDAQGGDTRLVLPQAQIVDMLRTFLPASTNDAKLTDQIERSIARVEEMGFLRKMKEDDEPYEVRRILRAFVNADFLVELEAVFQKHAEQLDQRA